MSETAVAVIGSGANAMTQTIPNIWHGSWVKCLACNGTGTLQVWDQYAPPTGAYRHVGPCSTCKGYGTVCVGVQP
jgi:DnaJ-class molecular chaperone